MVVFWAIHGQWATLIGIQIKVFHCSRAVPSRNFQKIDGIALWVCWNSHYTHIDCWLFFFFCLHFYNASPMPRIEFWSANSNFGTKVIVICKNMQWTGWMLFILFVWVFTLFLIKCKPIIRLIFYSCFEWQRFTIVVVCSFQFTHCYRNGQNVEQNYIYIYFSQFRFGFSSWAGCVYIVNAIQFLLNCAIEFLVTLH